MVSEIDDAEIVIVDIKAVANGYRLSRLIRSTVFNDREEDIGTLDDLIVGPDDRILFAVLQVGGFLRIGGRLIAVPFESLLLDNVSGRLRIILPGATREALETVPAFAYRD
jgi:PRC-barrel domain